ncbi:MAG: GWxTD domain-containing protein [Gemmatimonadetes bacterium]|nr:GWxTD domain-containing protein [Gemmatimonadota bacterium]
MTHVPRPRSSSVLVIVVAALSVLLVSPPSGAQQDASPAPVETPHESVVSGGDPDAARAPESAAFRHAYERLAAIEASGKENGIDELKEFFEGEIEAGRNLARSHNALGRAFLQEHEHVITILESVQKLFNWDHLTQARKNFRLATVADAGYVEAWYNWGVAGRKARGPDALREAADALRRTVDLDPAYRDAYRLLAVTLRDLGDFEGSERVLAEWRTSPGHSLALANLEEAFLALGMEGRTGEGAALYWAGLAAARDTAEVSAYLEDLRTILSEDEREEYAKGDAEARRAWITSWWQRAADASVVSRDERLAEHYRRLSHVERTFALAIPQRRHYSAITAYRPREQSGFDDRGIVYLRHGKPDDVARATGPNLQRNESWRYARPDGDLIFHFVSDEDVEDFKLVTSLASALARGNVTLGQRRNSAENAGELFESRAAFDPVYNRLAYQFDPMLLREEEEDVARDIRIGTSTASYVPESPDSLPFFAYPAAFRGESGEPEIELYFGVPTGELEMPAGTAGPRVAYTAHVVIQGEESKDAVAARAADSTTVEVPGSLSRGQGVLIPDVLTASVPSGEYRYRLRVSDLISRHTGTREGAFQVPDLRGFSASSLVLASRVEAGDQGKFSHGDLKVVPLPSLRFRPGQPVFIYYEIYGLSAGEDGRARYRTQYTVRTRERKRNIAIKVLGSVGNLLGTREERGEEVGLSVDGEAAAAERLREYISLDLNETEPGLYEVIVEIEDLESGRKVKRRAPFALTRDAGT